MRYLSTDYAEKMKGARRIVTVFADVKKGENVCVLTNPDKALIGEFIANATLEKGAITTIVQYEAPRFVNEDPPKIVQAALKASDVIFAITSRTLGMTKTRVEAREAGARWIQMPYFREELLIKDGIEVEPLEIKPVLEKVARIFAEGKEFELTTPVGTNLIAKIGREKGVPKRARLNAHEPGSTCGVPVFEISTDPLDADGIYVIDGTISIKEIGFVRNPVTLTIKNCYVTKIEGKEEAKALQNYMDSFNDPNVYRVAELAVGLNPYLRLSGTMLDEGVLGTAHMGLGCSRSLWAPTHFDNILLKPTLKIDGYALLDNGTLRI